MSENILCPVCQHKGAQLLSHRDFRELLRFSCPRCGSFEITNIAKGQITELDRARLCAWIRERKEFERATPSINRENLEEILRRIPNYSPSQKQLILLRAIERRTAYPGHRVSLDVDMDYPLAWASCAEEFSYYFDVLEQRGLLVAIKTEDRGRLTEAETQITALGWEYLDKHTKAAFTDQAFVAMAFSPQLIDIWEEGIKPAILEAGYKAYRVDREPHLERIDAKIITEIRNSRFLVADVTGQKQGVYFEAGFAMGLNLPVIWCVRKDELAQVHFDTRQYNHLLWETAAQLKEELYYLICATVGKNK